MLLLPEAAGPSDPAPSTPAREPGSIRRTSSIDTARPGGLRSDLMVDARARDLRTGPGGSAVVEGVAVLEARIDGANHQLVAIETTPVVPELSELLGVLVGPGFRRRVDELLPDQRAAGTLMYLLLDDLPGATLVSGYALQRAGVFDQPDTPPEHLEAMSSEFLSRDDLCAGWAHDATMMVTVRATGNIPVPMGPPAPILESPDDPWSWHAMAPMTPHGMRRRRRLDVLAPSDPGGPHRLDVHFRDSHADDVATETVVHEYSLTGTVDGTAGQIVDLAPRAHVLPWMECPGALASAHRVAGMPMAGLRTWVRRELTGTGTCTHLNDTLRSLADVPVLLPATEPSPT
ncbi:MAG TPA: DUF2889 domain-containing protein [Acidimicrobiales bacterium]|nr:DUF2889 domain-containing protein [Acidimicrobiales bacterium]